MWTKEDLRATIREQVGDALFLVVSNREPYIHRLKGEEIICETSLSGVAIALDPVMRACQGTWIAHGSGEADRDTVDAHSRVQVPPENPEYTLRRMWLTKEEEDGYYYGFANEGLWPLCHIAYSRPLFEETDWRTYCLVNQKFADAVLEEVKDRRAIVFVQDYHLAVLPRLLKRPNIITAQFWHIPWPNPEVFRVCPWAAEVLEGMLGNDLLGFHIRQHCQNFLDTVDMVLESRVDYERYEVIRGGKKTVVKPFPISVDYDSISADAASPEVQQEMDRLKRTHRLHQEWIGLGVDRIDYTKGIPERLRALDHFFERFPEFQRRMVFVEIGVPSREHLAAYKQISEEVEQMVEAINWKYQGSGWKPILYLKGAVSPTELRAWYRLANFCLVSSLHDGMNLVAKEYVASRVDEDGVLVLSRFTGSARELTEALQINPYATDQVAHAIHQALSISPEERRRRMRKLRATLQSQNIYRWAGKILSALLKFDFEKS